MMYRVRCVPAGGADVREEHVEAASEQAARSILQSRGLVVLGVHRGFASRASRRYDYPTFCRELRTLARAGMTVVEAVDTLAAKALASNGSSAIAVQLRDRLAQGQALSVALAGLAGIPPVLVAAVKAGERTSKLVEALDDYLRFDELVQQLRRKVVSAAIYPALVTALGIGITVFLVMVVMPNFARMYRSLRAGASGGTALVVEASQWLSAHRMESLSLLLALAVLLAWWIASGRALANITRWGRELPWVARRMADFQLAMLYQAVAVLLKGGYPMLEALRIAGQSALSEDLRRSLASATVHIAAGASVAQSLAAAGLADEVDRRLMAAAERNGDFYLVAGAVSKLHAERFELFVERTTRLAEPILLMAVALMVGTIVVMMYLPVFDMAKQLR